MGLFWNRARAITSRTWKPQYTEGKSNRQWFDQRPFKMRPSSVGVEEGGKFLLFSSGRPGKLSRSCHNVILGENRLERPPKAPSQLIPILTRIYNLKQTFLFSRQMRKYFRMTWVTKNGKGGMKEVGYSNPNCVANRYCDESICFVYCLSEWPTFSIAIQSLSCNEEEERKTVINNPKRRAQIFNSIFLRDV